MDTNVTISGGEGAIVGAYYTTASDRPTRIKITGGTLAGGGVRWVEADDVLFDNVRFESTGGRPALELGREGDRIAFINCSFYSSGDGFAHMDYTGYAADGKDQTDLIYANCSFESPTPGFNDSQGPFRIWGGKTRVIFVDNYVDRGGSQSHFRLHGDSANVWVADSQFVCLINPSPDGYGTIQADPDGGSGGTGSPTLGPLVFENNKAWVRNWETHGINNAFSCGTQGNPYGGVTGCVYTGNRTFAVEATGWTGQSVGDFNVAVTASDNLAYSYTEVEYETEPTGRGSIGADH